MKDRFPVNKSLSLGQKIERIRTFRGLKQEYLASKLGISQSRMSRIEQQSEIETELLQQIANVLKVLPEVIINFDDKLITYNINNYNNHEISELTDNNLDKISILKFDPISRIIELYERLLSSEREKIAMLNNLTN